MVKLFEQSRAWLIVVAVILMLAIMSACSTDKVNVEGKGTSPSPDVSQSANHETKEPDPEVKSLETKKVTDDLGREVEVPVAPKRVIAGEFASELLAVGIKPIGAGDNSFKIVYTVDDMAGVEKIGDPPNAEKILELQPDLFVAPTVFLEIYKEQMEQLEKFVPVYYISFDQDPIYDIFTKVASLVGRDQEAKTWITSYEQEAEQARQQLKTAVGEETVSIFRVEKGRLRIYLNRNFAGYMLRTGLQAKAPEAVAAELEKNPFGSAFEISLEKLPEYAGDHLLLIVRDEGDDKIAFDEMEKLDLWKNLPAVKSGRVHRLDTAKYYGSDIATIRETMKETLSMLTGQAAQ